MTRRTSSKSVEDDEVREIWPRLTRFYGLSYRELAHMPRIMLECYMEALPQLQADEQLRALEVSAYPHLEQKDAQRLHDFWVNVRSAGFTALRAEAEHRKPARLTRPEDAAAFGISVSKAEVI